MISVRLDRPWLIADLPGRMRCLSWAPVGSGFTEASQVVWREVRNADLTPDFDAEGWFRDEMAGHPAAVGMMTSRDIATFTQAMVEVEGVAAHCIATVGLTNGEAVGLRRRWEARDFGTINLVVSVEAGLTEAGQIEALSIATEARTAAVIEAGVDGPTGRLTGTGTDCLVLACRPGDLRHAGLHTAVGEAVGAAVKASVAAGASDWKRWHAGGAARRRP